MKYLICKQISMLLSWLGIGTAIFVIPVMGNDVRVRSAVWVALRAPFLELTIAPEPDSKKTHFSVGEPVVISVRLKNISKGPITLSETCETLDYKLTVKDNAGNLLPLTSQGKHLTNQFDMMCPRKHVKLISGQTKQVVMNVSMIYDLSNKGRYSISVSRGARSSEGNWAQEVSRPLALVIE